ncbi:CIPK11 [Symbiodinium necroappetens]|uniref:non-specific serine/threonine protein kinase n=1 Tax=Symbiodinium necroappetens TaxID=1628268 RepID=A0A812MBS9_9DINO|nr:CIPK11 [Symbiodinium necroappetens]
MADGAPPPPPPPLYRSASAGGIPVFRGCDLVIKSRSDLNFDGLTPAPDRVWYGRTVLEIGAQEWSVDKFLNYGAEGQTYLVTRTGTGEKFAAKFCNKFDSMEVKLVQELPRQLVIHDNFIKYEMIVLDVHETLSPAHHIIFMEHIPNGELFDVLASPEESVAGKPLSEGTSRRILHDVISGMAECYRYGVTHRDLKPENLLINEQGRIVIIDMGHAKRVRETGSPSPPSALTLARATTTNPYGTPAFNAPEVSGGRAYDCEWSDVWSVGVIAFYLHGKLPAFSSGGGVASWDDVSGTSNEDLWRKITTCGYYPQFPEELRFFINALWRIDPSERPRFNQLEKAITGDTETLNQFPGLQWLARPVNDDADFIDELSRSCPNNSFHLSGGPVKRW